MSNVRSSSVAPGVRTPSRRWRTWSRVALGALIALFGVLAAFAWRYSDLILGPDRPPTLQEQRVLAAEPGRVRLSRDHESLAPGVWALQWQDGFGRVGRVIAADSASVLREFRSLVGTPPVGGWASLRGVSRSADPRTMLGLTFEDVAFHGPLGSYPAWFVPGSDSTWVLYVHGRATDRPECLRTLSVLAARGLPGLLVTYRNDVGAPRSPDGRYHLGLTEWEDLEGAVEHALSRGARVVVLCGYSMGGHIVMQFMSRSKLAPHVRGVVLESPVLDWNQTLAFRARALGVPSLGTWLGQQVAAARARLDWNQLDLVGRAGHQSVPVLIFHGVHDTYSPPSVSAAYALAFPGTTTLVRVPRGNHVEAWNVGPERYAADLNRWFDAHQLGGSAH